MISARTTRVSSKSPTSDGAANLRDAEHAAAQQSEHGDPEDNAGGRDHTTGAAERPDDARSDARVGGLNLLLDP